MLHCKETPVGDPELGERAKHPSECWWYGEEARCSVNEAAAAVQNEFIFSCLGVGTPADSAQSTPKK